MKTWIGLLLLGLTPAIGAAERFSAASIEPMYRAYRFATQPKLNPAVKFGLAEVEIPGLWAALAIQVFNAHDLIRDQSIPRNPILCYRGKIEPFVESFGGQGLMSAVMAGQTLYYTFAWGSGIHRSQVGRLQIVDGTLRRTDSAGILSKDLFVEKMPDGRIRVVEGQWRGFNRWERGVWFGWIDLHDDSRLSLVDEAGHAVPLNRK